MSIAFLFPGQGSQYPGMMHKLPEHPAVRETFAQAAAVLGDDPGQLDSGQALQSTVNVQLALLIAGVSVARALLTEGVSPAAVAGLSVGAYGAAVICGTLAFQDAVAMIRLRAQLMESQFAEGYGLSAIVGLTEQQVSRLVEQANSAEAPVFVSNVNAQRQIVIAGADSAMEKVLNEARRQGATKAERLRVSVPSHCPLLTPVATRLKEEFRKLEIRNPSIPYISNVRARPLRTAQAVAEDLATNVAHGVRWSDTTYVLAELGCDLFIEMQPGHVLTNLAAEALPQIRSIAAEAVTISYLQRIARDQSKHPADGAVSNPSF
jgi:malonate decarboxylase epsilon subunit